MVKYPNLEIQRFNKPGNTIFKLNIKGGIEYILGVIILRVLIICQLFAQ